MDDTAGRRDGWMRAGSADRTGDEWLLDLRAHNHTMRLQGPSQGTSGGKGHSSSTERERDNKSLYKVIIEVTRRNCHFNVCVCV